MAERTVAVGLIAYAPADAPHLSLWGQHGAVVDVHSDDIERFDSLNGTPAAPPSASLSVDEHPAADGNAAPAVPPGGNAALVVWREFALASGATEADVDGLTRDELRERFAPTKGA